MKKFFDGEKFRQIRIEKGFTQEEVSEMTKSGKIFVNEKTISHWENCPTSNPRKKNLEAVAKVLETNIEEFFTEDIHNCSGNDIENKNREDSKQYLTDAELITEIVKLVLDPSYQDKKWILKNVKDLLVEHLF